MKNVLLAVDVVDAGDDVAGSIVTFVTGLGGVDGPGPSFCEGAGGASGLSFATPS